MVGIAGRMLNLRAMLAIRTGPGAAVLPPEVTRIHMEFAKEAFDGHRGAKMFWRKCLPRLKYHNPAVPMTISRDSERQGPSLMTIHFTSPEAAENTKTEISSTTQSQTSTAPVAGSQAGPGTERMETIDMKHSQDSQILEKLLEITKATPLKATAEELRQIQEIEEANARYQRVARNSKEKVEKRKKEEAVMKQLMGEVD